MGSRKIILLCDQGISNSSTCSYTIITTVHFLYIATVQFLFAVCVCVCCSQIICISRKYIRELNNHLNNNLWNVSNFFKKYFYILGMAIGYVFIVKFSLV